MHGIDFFFFEESITELYCVSLRTEIIVDIDKGRFGVHEIYCADNFLKISQETNAIVASSKQFFS